MGLGRGEGIMVVGEAVLSGRGEEQNALTNGAGCASACISFGEWGCFGSSAHGTSCVFKSWGGAECVREWLGVCECSY